VALDLSVTDLADGDGNSGSVDLRLAIRNGCDNGGLDNLGANSGLSSTATAASIAVVVATAAAASTGATARATATARDYSDLDGLAMRCPLAVVQVVEVSRLALIPGSLSLQGQ
jgi:hypothetical protein